MSRPHAYVADCVVRVKLGVAVMDEMARYEERLRAGWAAMGTGGSSSHHHYYGDEGPTTTRSSKKSSGSGGGGGGGGWLERLRDQLQRGADIRWYVVVCGDEDRLPEPGWAPPESSDRVERLRELLPPEVTGPTGTQWSSSAAAGQPVVDLPTQEAQRQQQQEEGEGGQPVSPSRTYSSMTRFELVAAALEARAVRGPSPASRSCLAGARATSLLAHTPLSLSLSLSSLSKMLPGLVSPTMGDRKVGTRELYVVVIIFFCLAVSLEMHDQERE